MIARHCSYVHYFTVEAICIRATKQRNGAWWWWRRKGNNSWPGSTFIFVLVSCCRQFQPLHTYLSTYPPLPNTRCSHIPLTITHLVPLTPLLHVYTRTLSENDYTFLPVALTSQFTYHCQNCTLRINRVLVSRI